MALSDAERRAIKDADYFELRGWGTMDGRKSPEMIVAIMRGCGFVQHETYDSRLQMCRKSMRDTNMGELIVAETAHALGFETAADYMRTTVTNAQEIRERLRAL